MKSLRKRVRLSPVQTTFFLLSVAVSVVVFLYILRICIDAAQIHGGIALVFPLILVFILGIGEFTFIRIIQECYRNTSNNRELIGYFSIVLSGEGFLIGTADLVHLLLYTRAFKLDLKGFFHFWKAVNFAFAVGGIFIGVIFLLLWLWIRRRPA